MAAMAGENDLECPLRPRDHFECDELGSKFLNWYYSINLNVKELVMQIFLKTLVFYNFEGKKLVIYPVYFCHNSLLNNLKTIFFPHGFYKDPQKFAGFWTFGYKGACRIIKTYLFMYHKRQHIM